MQQPTPDRTAQEQAGKEDLIKYVEKLASAEEYPPGDAWVSITDAARVTRTSEAMARRWVTSGRLAIKPGEYGIPPRTRLVRLSDVAKIRPIVDPGAAVSDEVHKLDLASIPQQQKQIMADHERLLVETSHLTEMVEQFTASQREALEQLTNRLSTLDETHSHTLESLKIALAETSATLEQQLTTLNEHLISQFTEVRGIIGQQSITLSEQANTISHEQHQRQQNIEELQRRIKQAAQESQTALAQAKATIGTEQATQDREIRETSTALVQVQHTLTHLQRDLQLARSDLRTAIDNAYHRAIKETSTLIEEQVRNLSKDIATLEQDQAKDVAMLNGQLEHLTDQVTQISTTITRNRTEAQGNQQRATAQDERITTLEKQLEEEKQARLKLESQVQALIKAKGQPGRK